MAVQGLDSHTGDGDSLYIALSHTLSLLWRCHCLAGLGLWTEVTGQVSWAHAPHNGAGTGIEFLACKMNHFFDFYMYLSWIHMTMRGRFCGRFSA